jgi:hypothetical protein
MAAHEHRLSQTHTRKQVLMSFDLWYQMLKDSIYWQNIPGDMAVDIYHRTVVAWGHGQNYYLQSGPERVDLTKLYEQCKLIETLKGTNYDKEIPWGG